MSEFSNSDFIPLVHFFLGLNHKLVFPPIKGDVICIQQMFVKEKNLSSQLINKISSLDDFLSYLAAFNDIGGGLEFDRSLSNTNCDVSYFHHPRLLTLNIPKLTILREFLIKGDAMEVVSFKENPALAAKNDLTKLLSLLDIKRFHSTIELEGNRLPRDSNPDYSLLEELLQKPTAKRDLSKIKAKVTTETKPFYQICSDQNHANKISNLISGIKSSHGEMPPPDKIRKLIDDSSSGDIRSCCQSKVHFVPIIHKQTDTSLGDCSYLDTCHKLSQCRYIHYYTLNPPPKKPEELDKLPRLSCEYTIGDCFTEHTRAILKPQWINCDVRYFPFPVIGKFAAIISDPAWEVRMNLPYGTCKDFELLGLPINLLQDEGIILLWVTGRSIEVGRQALTKWGYRISDELIWIKLNQLKRTIVTGRTGHWLNHSKEHLLVGIKGNPQWINKMMDIDIVVSNSRQTLRKPDEIYDIVERIVGKHSRKLEIFGRDHNIRPGWLSMYTQYSVEEFFY